MFDEDVDFIEFMRNVLLLKNFSQEIINQAIYDQYENAGIGQLDEECI